MRNKATIRFREWVNGYCISCRLDDNLCSKFRADIVIMDSETDDIMKLRDTIRYEEFPRSPLGMATALLEARDFCDQQKEGGSYPEFDAEVDE